MRKHRTLACASALLACAVTAAACGGTPEATEEAEPTADFEAAAAPAAPASEAEEQAIPATPEQSGEPAARSQLAAPVGGTIKGRIRFAGRPPGNPIIRMGADPLCSRINRGTRVVQEAVLTTADGGLANVFVKLDGSFPRSPVPAAPVTIDQRGCIYSPRMVGIRVGQMLAVRNSDALMHNVHGVSGAGNGFNVSQPKAGMVRTFHTIRTWHERYGPLTQTVRVTADATTTVDVEYTGNEKPPTASVRDLHVPVTAVHLAAR